MVNDPSEIQEKKHHSNIKTNSDIKKEDIVQIVKCHRTLLGHTSSSKAGEKTLNVLYQALVNDPNAIVLWHQAQEKNGSVAGSFLSATTQYDATKKRMKASLSVIDFLKLGFLKLIDMPHTLASFKFSKILSNESSFAYLLTIGCSKSSEYQQPELRLSGAQILKDFETKIKDQVSQIYLDVEEGNIRAIDFYKKHGFVEFKRAFKQMLLRKEL